MNSDGKFWATVWCSLFALITVIAICTTIYSVGAGREIEFKKIEAIASSKDPIATGCAFGFTEKEAPVCASKAQLTHN